MTNVIRFLESIGTQQISVADYVATVSELELADEERQALLNRDHSALNDLLGGRPTMFFGVLAPDEEPSREDEEPAEDEPREPKEAN